MKTPLAIRRYATALIALAQETAKSQEIYADMQYLLKALSENEDFDMLLRNPLIESMDKIKVIRAISPSIQPLTFNVLKLLARNGRLSYLKELAYEVILTIDTDKGIVRGSLTTAVPITKKSKQQIMNKLATKYSGEILLEEDIDRSILGGFLIRVGDTQYDASIMGHLDRLKTVLKTT